MNSTHWAFIAIGLLGGGWIAATMATGQQVTEIPADLKTLIWSLFAYATGRQIVKSVSAAKKIGVGSTGV